MDVTRKTLPERHYLYVAQECPYGPEIATAMGAAFGEAFGFVGQKGVTPLAHPMAVYWGMDPKILRFHGGFLVSPEDAAKAEGNVKSGILPAGEVMMAVHVGSYGKMNETHEALWSHIKAEGLTGDMPVWEVYIDDPGEVPEEELRTEIYCMLG